MSIDNELDMIKNNPYMETMRDAIHDGIKKGYDKSVTAENYAAEVKDTYDQVLLQWDSDPNKDPELITARDGEASLNDRLDRDNTEYAEELISINTKIENNEQENQNTFDAVTAQLAQTVNDVAESVQSVAMPENISTVNSRSAKLVLTHPSNDKTNVIQFNGKDYVIYELDAANGTANESVGVNWDLIRLKKAIRASGAYVAKKNHNTPVGTLDTLYEPSTRNTIEDFIVYEHPDEVPTEFLSSPGDGLGVGVYGLSHTSEPSTVSYDVKIGTNGKCNVLLFGTSTSSEDVDILVNGEVVKNINTRKFGLGTNLTYKIVEFEIPTRVNIVTDVKVVLRNNDTSGNKLYFSCLNFLNLKDYDGRDVDLYKVFTTSQKWIDHDGASDYAIFDHDLQKWCGSYHGGEERISARYTYSTGGTWNPTTQWDTGRYTLRNKVDIPVGWYLTPSLKIQQLTNINSKGEMLSILDFDTYGTLQMNFSFFKGTINVDTFYTALTTTHVDFNMIRYPKYKGLEVDGSNEYLQNSEGYVIQNNSAKGISIGQRYTLFGDRYIENKLKNKGWIYNHSSYYKKLYYGIVEDFADGVFVEDLQFRKALDFMSE